jgi:hypothetical protein
LTPKTEKPGSHTALLNKGRTFLIRYKISLDKQFAAPDLLFLAAFGEAATGRMVARLLVGEASFADPPNASKTFLLLPLHEGTIDLEAFECFLQDKCAAHSMAAVQIENFELVAAMIKLIADGRNIWDGSENHSDAPSRLLYAAFWFTSVDIGDGGACHQKGPALPKDGHG